MSDIVERLREWSAADMDTHASLRRNGAQVAEVPWSRHGTDLAETVLDAAAEIERLRAEKRAIALQAIADQTQAQENWEEVQRLRAEVERVRPRETGFMCLTDFECELGYASGGNVIYPSVDDIKARRKCVASCGIVEVAVCFVRVVEPGIDISEPRP